MPADPAADLGGVLAATVIESAVLVAAARRVVLGLGVTKQHQTAHDGILDVIRSLTGLMYMCRALRTR